jgi:hypothetical protein
MPGFLCIGLRHKTKLGGRIGCRPRGARRLWNPNNPGNQEIRSAMTDPFSISSERFTRLPALYM